MVPLEAPMIDPATNEAALASAVRTSAIEFLRVELKIANTMLDLAASTHEQEAHARRRAQAVEAYNTVKRYLAEPPVPLPEADSQEILDSLRVLEQRMRAAR
jgi:hypothetical protein